MIYYLLLFKFFFFSILSEKFKINKFLEVSIFLTLFLVIAFRYETGGDWTSYEIINNYYHTENFSIFDEVFSINLTTSFFNYIILLFENILKLEINIFFFHSVFFCVFYFIFIKQFPDIFFSLIVSFPVLIILLSMGFLKQGLALSTFAVFLSIANSRIRYLFFFLTPFFHPPSLVLLIIYSLSKFFFLYKLNFLKILSLLLLVFSLYIIFRYQIKLYIDNYLSNENSYYSTGAIHRTLINVFCSILYLFIYVNNKYLIPEKFRNFFLIIAIFCLLLFPFVFFFDTATDRVFLYFSLIQIAGPSYFYLYFHNSKFYYLIKYFLIVLFIFIFLSWNLFSANSVFWDYNFFF